MVIGWVCGKDDFKGNTRISHKLMLEVTKRFEDEYGSILCKEVRPKAMKNCPVVVGNACKWAAEVLIQQFGK